MLFPWVLPIDFEKIPRSFWKEWLSPEKLLGWCLFKSEDGVSVEVNSGQAAMHCPVASICFASNVLFPGWTLQLGITLHPCQPCPFSLIPDYLRFHEHLLFFVGHLGSYILKSTIHSKSKCWGLFGSAKCLLALRRRKVFHDSRAQLWAEGVSASQTEECFSPLCMDSLTGRHATLTSCLWLGPFEHYAIIHSPVWLSSFSVSVTKHPKTSGVS